MPKFYIEYKYLIIADIALIILMSLYILLNGIILCRDNIINKYQVLPMLIILVKYLVSIIIFDESLSWLGQALLAYFSS